jgi:putative NADH-flavin reductase
MTWLGGFVLGLGVLLVAALAGSRIMRVVRRRAGSRTAGACYAERLDAEAETGDQDDIHRTADALIREHGAAAVIEAARRTLSNLDDRDLKSRAVWRQVLASAEERRRKDRPQDEAAE